MRRTAVFVCFILSVALPQPALSDAADSPVARVAREHSSNTGSLKQQIAVQVENLNALLQQASAANIKPVLFLNGQEITNVFGAPNGPVDGSGAGTLLFLLDRNSSNQDAWKGILSEASLQPKVISVSVGLHGQPPIPTFLTDFQLTVIHGSWLAAWAVAFVVFFGLFLWKAKTTSLLRDGDVNSTFSLARCQMAWWFFLVLASYLFVYMITWDFNTISPGTLALIGISAATGLAGVVVDSSKKDSLLAEQKQLQTELTTGPAAARAAQIQTRLDVIRVQTSPSPHVNFLSDILTDSNGVSFHRLQMLVWTIVLGVIFVISVYTDLTMPDFTATLLGLMGISSGTYIGFKIPEVAN